MIVLSISNDLTDGFIKKYIPTCKLAEYTMKYCYSASTYTSTHRHKDNIDSLGNVLIFDFDDGAITINQMKEFLHKNNIYSIICTTKSHQKEKNGKPAVDRFRLFLPLSKEIELDIDTYADFYMYIAKLLNIDEVIDTACKNPSRSYYPNASQVSTVVNSHNIFNTDVLIEQFNRYIKKHKKERTQKQVDQKAYNQSYSNKNYSNNSNELKGNEVLADTMVELRSGERYSLREFEYLQGSDTVPCRCINPSHEDRNPSAFVGRSSKSGRLMVKCSGCGVTYFVAPENRGR